MSSTLNLSAVVRSSLCQTKRFTLKLIFVENWSITLEIRVLLDVTLGIRTSIDYCKFCCILSGIPMQ
jgi:hypothetical protein